MVKFKIDSPHFIEAVNWVTKNYDRRGEKAHILFDLDSENGSSISHENDASYMKSPITITNADLGDKDNVQVAVDGNYLKRLTAAIKNTKELEFSWDDDDSGINIKTQNGEFTCPILDVNIRPAMKINVLGEVDNDYFDNIQDLSKLCDSKDGEYIPVISTVDLQFNTDDKKLTMMATDRYTLGEIITSFEPNEEFAKEYFNDNPHIFLHHASASLISGVKNNLTSVSIINGKRGDKYGYSFADGKIALFATKEVTPLKYTKIKTKAIEGAVNNFTVDTDDLKKAISIVSSLAWEETSIVLQISEDEITITDNNNKNSLAVEAGEINTDKDYKVKFVRNTINEAFAPINTEKVKIKWKDNVNAFVFAPILDNGEEVDNVFVFTIPLTEV